MNPQESGAVAEVHRLIVEAAVGARTLTDDELQRVLEHVAQAGFDPDAQERVRGRLAGRAWRGRTLRGRDTLPPSELKYVWHVVERGEWPDGTTMTAYVESIKAVVLDPTSRIFVGQYERTWQLSIARESGELRGPRGSDWVLVEYRLETGHWVTALQPRDSLEAELHSPKRSVIRWLRD